MNGKKTLKSFSLIALDTNIFIYHYQKSPEFTKYTDKIFEGLIANKFKAITSIISLIELLAIKESVSKLDELEYSFNITPNLRSIVTGYDIAVEAARIRRDYGFKFADTIQLATAATEKAQVFITNDKRLKKFKQLKVLLLSELRT